MNFPSNFRYLKKGLDLTKLTYDRLVAEEEIKKLKAIFGESGQLRIGKDDGASLYRNRVKVTLIYTLIAHSRGKLHITDYRNDYGVKIKIRSLGAQAKRLEDQGRWYKYMKASRPTRKSFLQAVASFFGLT